MNNNNMHKIITAKRLGWLFRYIILIVLAVIILFPFATMILKSFMSDDDVLEFPARFLPSAVVFNNYVAAFSPELFIYFKNTLYVIFMGVIGGVGSAALCAYGFSKVKFQGREICFGIVLSTIMLPGIVVQIPLYSIFYKLGWINTLNPLVIPAFFGGGAINIFLLRQYMKSIPNTIDEAAVLDGAGLMQKFFSIYIPLSKPILFYMIIQVFFGAWNDFVGPLMYVHDENMYTIAVGIYFKYMEPSIADLTYNNVKMALGVILLIPCIILFSLFQKQLIAGVSTSGIKG